MMLAVEHVLDRELPALRVHSPKPEQRQAADVRELHSGGRRLEEARDDRDADPQRLAIPNERKQGTVRHR